MTSRATLFRLMKILEYYLQTRLNSRLHIDQATWIVVYSIADQRVSLDTI